MAVYCTCVYSTHNYTIYKLTSSKTPAILTLEAIVERVDGQRDEAFSKMVIINITVYTSDSTEVENRNDANNGSGQSTFSVSAFHTICYI